MFTSTVSKIIDAFINDIIVLGKKAFVGGQSYNWDEWYLFF